MTTSPCQRCHASGQRRRRLPPPHTLQGARRQEAPAAPCQGGSSGQCPAQRLPSAVQLGLGAATSAHTPHVRVLQAIDELLAAEFLHATRCRGLGPAVEAALSQLEARAR